MNQILDIKKKNRKIVIFFKIQFVFSIIMVLIWFIYIFQNIIIKNKENEISKTMKINAKLNTLYSGNENNVYFCRIIIKKINLDYFVYNSYSDELLKILPCKFSGTTLQENGNICIIAHNYFDDRFFSNINKLGENDEIIIKDLLGNEYKYYVYDIYEIDEKNITEVIKMEENKKIITLCTCTLNKEKRLIVKAILR